MAKDMMTLPPTPLIPHAEVMAGIRKPGELLCPTGLIFTKGEQFMRRFYAKLMGSASREAAERFCLIDGPMGAGKTILATDSACRAGLSPYELPSSSLGGATENAAVEVLRATMTGLESYSHATGELPVLILNDFHLSIAGTTDDKIGRSINSNTLTLELQRLADLPKPYRAVCGMVIPIVFTGNDFSKTTPSLFRDMRASRYTHTPTYEEKIHIIFTMFNPRTRADVNLVEKLVRTYRRQPIAYWAALKNDLLSTHLDGALPEGPLTREAIDAKWPNRLTLDADIVWSLAKARATDASINHY